MARDWFTAGPPVALWLSSLWKLSSSAAAPRVRGMDNPRNDPQRSSLAVTPPLSQSTTNQLLCCAYNNQGKIMFVFFFQEPEGIFFKPRLYMTDEGDPRKALWKALPPLLDPRNKNKTSAQTSTKIHQNRGKKKFYSSVTMKKKAAKPSLS